MKRKILIVDDDMVVLEGVKLILDHLGYLPLTAQNGKEAFWILEKEEPKIVLLDLRLGEESGLEILKKMKETFYSIPVIMFSAYGEISTAVEAMKYGAYDFITKPVDSEKLSRIMNRAIENKELKEKLEKANSALEGSLEGQLGVSRSMKKVIQELRHVIDGDLAIILQGETGTGKSYIADVIHNLSKRRDKPFVKVDIGSIPENLVESELFGHVKGAFTGAINNKKGYFELADTGTIFIDEIENMSPYVQMKLLSVLEEKKVYPLGTNKAIEIDIHIITATNSDIKKSVQDKMFREDLYYRIGEIIIDIPPLRDRKEGIAFLAYKFLNEDRGDLHKNVNIISKEALNQLTSYNWPGNIRELKSVIKKAILYCDSDVISEKHTNLMNAGENGKLAASPVISFKEVVKEAEKNALHETLLLAEGNKSKAADMLRLNYKTFLKKIKDYNLDYPKK